MTMLGDLLAPALQSAYAIFAALDAAKVGAVSLLDIFMSLTLMGIILRIAFSFMDIDVEPFGNDKDDDD